MLTSRVLPPICTLTFLKNRTTSTDRSYDPCNRFERTNKDLKNRTCCIFFLDHFNIMCIIKDNRAQSSIDLRKHDLYHVWAFVFLGVLN